MSYPDFTKPFIVAHCDASEKGLGAVLYQEIDGKMKLISYASRTLTHAEKNYHLRSRKLEFLALKWSVTEKFWDYFYYVNEFTVYSDNNPQLYVMSTAKLNATGMRQVSVLAEFGFKIKYRPEKSGQDCDYLSRNDLSFVEDKFSSYAEETDLENFKIFVNSISNLENNWLTATAKQPEILETYLNLKADKELIKIQCQTLKYEQLNDRIISPIFEGVSSQNRPSFKDQKPICRKS